MTEQSIQEKVAENGVTCDQDTSKKKWKPLKTYIHRNSVLTDAMEVAHVRTVYNMSLAIFVILLGVTIAYYIARPETFYSDISVITWSANKLHIAFVLWLSLNLMVISVHQAYCGWVLNRHRIPLKVADFLFISYFVSICILMFTATPYATMKLGFHPITAFAYLAEQVRLFMKVYSFVRESYPRARKYVRDKDGNQAQNLCPTFQHFVYYMFAPVLIYRDNYPRTEKIRWNFVISNLAQHGACIFIAYCLFHRVLSDTFRRVGIEPFPLHQVVLIYGGCAVAGSIFMFVIFFGLLHSWLNAFAEILRFGDRLFYQDWWNSTTFTQYYRMWNGVVYDWIYTYVYMEMYKAGVSRTVSMFIVFAISSAVHDYIICFGLGFFFPALGLVYSTVGVLVNVLTRSKASNMWNTFMWFMLFSGWGVLMFLYSWEWYARMNCPLDKDELKNYFIPRSLSCQILAS